MNMQRSEGHPIKYRVRLSADLRHGLMRLINEGISPAIKITHARILILADESPNGKKWRDDQIAEALLVARTTVRRVRRRFVLLGLDSALSRTPSRRSLNRKLFDPNYKSAIFKVLHCPPKLYGFNRTTWRQQDLSAALKLNGVQIGKNYISKIIHNAGYRCRHVKEVLTSNDPRYREKVGRILTILRRLKNTERFFSIDEFGPVAIRKKGGRRLVAPGETPTVPQFQRSKGRLILTGALELSTNQMTHFYSTGKNTDEMIRLLELLLDQYRSCTKLYLSWDAAGWHTSKQFKQRVKEVNSAKYRAVNRTPVVRLAPLPSRAQFLNVIESVFSGLAVSIIHNSDYQSLSEAKAAVNRYFRERNDFFQKNPKKAGNKIWGKERVASIFEDGQNCKNPRFR